MFGSDRARLRHAGTQKSSDAAVRARIRHFIWQAITLSGAAHQRSRGRADAGVDRVLPALRLTDARPPLPLHAHLQRLWPGGDPEAWPLEGGLAHRETVVALPSLHPLWL